MLEASRTLAPSVSAKRLTTSCVCDQPRDWKLASRLSTIGAAIASSDNMIEGGTGETISAKKDEVG